MKFKPLDEEKKANLLQQINTVVSEVEDNETYSLNEDEQKVIANALHNLFIKISKIPSEKETGHKSAPKGYPQKAKMYADPVNFKYPIDTEEHARAAWSYIHQARNRKEYSSEELKSMENRIRKALDKYNVDIEEEKDAH